MAKLFANKFNLDNLPDPVKVKQGDRTVDPHIRVEPLQPATVDTQRINKKLYDLGLQKGQIASRESILEKQGVRQSVANQLVSFVSVSRFGLRPVNQGSTDITPPKRIDPKQMLMFAADIKKVAVGDRTFDPKTIINIVEPGDRTFDPKTVINKIEPGDRTFNPNTVIKVVQPGERTIDPKTTITEVKPGERTFNPNTIIKNVEPGSRTIDPDISIQKTQPKKELYLVDNNKGTGFTNPGAESKASTVSLPRNWSGTGATIFFPKTISLKDRLKQPELGTTKHLAEYILSDQNTGQIKIYRRGDPEPKKSPVLIKKVEPGDRTFDPKIAIQKIKPGDRIVDPKTPIIQIKPGDRIVDPKTVIEKIKPGDRIVNPKLAIPRIKPGDRIVDPNTKIIQIKPGDRTVNPNTPIKRVIADEQIVDPKTRIKKVLPGSRTTNPNTVIQIVKPGDRIVDPQLRILPIEQGDRTFNPNIQISLVEPGERTIDPGIVLNRILPGERTINPELEIRPVVSGDRTFNPNTKVRRVNGTSRVQNPGTVINKIKPGDRTFNPNTRVSRVRSGNRTIDPQTRVEPIRPGERTIIPAVRLYLFPQVDNKIFFTQEPDPYVSELDVYYGAATTTVYEIPDFQQLRYFVSDVNINSSRTSDTLNTDTSPFYDEKIPKFIKDSGVSYPNLYYDKQPYVQPLSNTTLSTSPLRNAAAQAQDSVDYSHDVWSPGGQIQENKTVLFPNPQWGDPNLPGGYRALNYGQAQRRASSNPNKNLDFTYIESTDGSSPSSGLKPYRERLGMPEQGADTLNTSYDKTGVDLVAIKFQSVRDGNVTLQFRSFLKNFADSYTALYTDVNYVGRPDTLKVFKGTTRQLSLAFTVPAFSEDELKVLYQKLEKLVKIGTMGKATSAAYMQGPFLRLTVGGWCDKTPIVLGSLKYETQPTEYSWDIKHEVPHIVDVSMDCIALSANNGDNFLESSTFIQYGKIS